MRKVLCLLLFGVLAPGTAGQEFGNGVVEEVRLGLHSHAAHNSLWPLNVNEFDMERVEDITFDVLFNSPGIDAFTVIGSPLFELGTTINFAGRESTAHAALVWQLPLPDSPVFLEGAFGAAIHNGHLMHAPAGERNLGCRVNFYERFGVGVNLDEHVTALVSYEHTSNAGLCPANEGYSNVGLRLGRKF